MTLQKRARRACMAHHGHTGPEACPFPACSCSSILYELQELREECASAEPDMDSFGEDDADDYETLMEASMDALRIGIRKVGT